MTDPLTEREMSSAGSGAHAPAAGASIEALQLRRGPWQRYGWLMSVVWLGFLYFPSVGLLQSQASVWAVGLGWAALVGFGVSYLAGFVLGLRRGWHQPSRAVVLLFFAAVLSSLLTLPAIGWGITSFSPFLMAFAAYVLGPLWHWVTSGASIALTLTNVFVDASSGREAPLMLLAIVLIMFAVNSINLWLIGRSITADELSLDLATSEERESVARDVHDLLGHSLTVIKLKSELAIRLIDKDPTGARAELEEITALTSEAIAGVHGTVTGLRTTERHATSPTPDSPDAGGLLEQLHKSQAALQSAGVSVKVVGDPNMLSPAQAITATWILREATTNVLRHSQAHRVRISLEPGIVCIEDDGVGVQGEPGNGMLGMRERATAAGATLRVEARGGLRGTTQAGTRVSLTW